jgi:hypothetical protein
MRYPGENAAGRTPARRQNPSGRITPSQARHAPGGAAGTGGGRAAAASDASLFAPGYTNGRSPAVDDASDGGGWLAPVGAASQGPVRGFPPAPGQPAPLYPPGQFAAWNRGPTPGENGYDPGLTGPLTGTWQAGVADAISSPQARYSEAGYADTGYADTGYSDQGYATAGYADSGYTDAVPDDPGYSALAVSDHATEATNAPSWGFADDTAATSAWGDASAPAGGAWGDASAPAGGAWGDASAPAGHAADTVSDPIATGPQRASTGPQRVATGPQRAATGPFDLATPAPFNTGQNQAIAAGPGTDTAGPRTAPGRGQGGRGRGSRGRKRPGGPSKIRALLICGVALIVVAGAAYFYFARSHASPSPAADSRSTSSAKPSTDPSPSPSLGQWGHIDSRALDPAPLTLAELFPGSFVNGTTTYVRTAQKAKVHCAGSLAGSQLVTAVSHAGCTQAMRASYLSSDHKVMGTIGVLNLITATAAERAGKATGPSEFIAQLPGARGLTKNLTKGTGIEAAEVKGHYLVLVWAELANLHTPRTPLQKSELEEFITLLMQRTANVSLATRQVTGSPPP